MIHRYLKNIVICFALLAGAAPMLAQAPTIKSVGPTSGSTAGGTVVTIIGTGFVAGSTTVSFGGTAGTGVTVLSGTTTALTVTAPAHAAGAVAVTVTTSGGTSSGGADTFTYTAPTTTTLAVSGTQTVGDVLTLTATVKVTSSSAAVETGAVKFCNSALALNLCTVGRGLWGTAQLTTSGTAVFRSKLPVGTHNIEAVFVGTTADATSTSSATAITISASAIYPSTTTVSVTGSEADWTLSGTVAGLGGLGAANATPDAPSGTITLTDTTESTTIATAPLSTPVVTLSAPTLYLGASSDTVADESSGISVGDFNNDGNPDLILIATGTNATLGQGSFSVLLGSGVETATGNFNAGGTPTPIDLSTSNSQSQTAAVGDLSGTGDLSAVFSNAGGGVDVEIGNGAGGFIVGLPLSNSTDGSGQLYSGVALGDFNNDGILDVVGAGFSSADSNDGSVDYWQGTSTPGSAEPTFASSTSATGGTNSGTITTIGIGRIFVGDFDGDGNLDFAVTTGVSQSTGRILVYYGNGNGTFTAGPILLPGATATNHLVIADFDGDGLADIAATSAGEVFVYRSNGAARTFTLQQSISNSAANGIATGDFNGDGMPDLAMASGSSVAVLINASPSTPCASTSTSTSCIVFDTAAPSFTTSISSATSNGNAVAVGDFNGDGIPDIGVAVLSTSLPSSVVVLLGEQQTSFSVSGVGLPANLASGVPSMSSIPEHGVHASFPGDTLRTASTSSPINVGAGLLTAVSVTSSASPAAAGVSDTLTAHLTSQVVNGSAVAPTGTVSFTQGSTTLCSSSAVGSGVATCATSALAVGANQTITAVYSGDKNYFTETGTLTGLTVDASSTTTVALTTGTTPAAAGSPLTFTATVTPNTGGTSGGATTTSDTVTFTDSTGTTLNCNSSGTHVVNLATASSSSPVNVVCATSSLSTLGANIITATYTSASDLGSSSGTTTVAIDNTTTTTLATSGTPSISGASVTFTATVSSSGGTPTGSVSFSDTTSSTTLCSSVALSSGTAACPTTALTTIGNNSITAAYTGTGNFSNSTSSPLTQAVDKATATTIAASPATAVFGQPVTLTATVSNVSVTGTGTVSFTQNGAAIAGCGAQAVNASGVATCATSSLPVGSSAQIDAQATFTSQVTSSTPFLASSPISSAAALTISQASTTTTLTSSGAATTLVNAPPAFTATVAVVSPATGTPAGTVTFSINGSAVGSPVALNGNGQATFTPTGTQLPTGNDTITAAYTATTNLAASTSSALAQTVLNGTSTTVALTAGTSAITFGTAVTFTATVSDTTGGPTPSGGTVTFTDTSSNTTLCTVTLAGGSAACTPATSLLTTGSHVISAAYSGVMAGTTFFQASSSGTLTETVNKAPALIALSSSSPGNPPTSVFGNTVTFTASFAASVNGVTPTGTVTFKVDGTPLSQGPVTISGQTAAFSINNLTVAGISGHTITATYNGDNNFQ